MVNLVRGGMLAWKGQRLYVPSKAQRIDRSSLGMRSHILLVLFHLSTS